MRGFVVLTGSMVGGANQGGLQGADVASDDSKNPSSHVALHLWIFRKQLSDSFGDTVYSGLKLRYETGCQCRVVRQLNGVEAQFGK